MDQRLSRESTERCAALLRALRERLDLTLAQCAIGMGLCPTSSDAGLARMEHAIGTWSRDCFERFLPFAALHVSVSPAELRAVLLGDRDPHLIEDILRWQYARIGSEDCSKLLCRMECRWRPGSHWTIAFKYLPGFMLPDQPRELTTLSDASPRAEQELSEVFASMHDRFLAWEPSTRPRLTLIPLPSALSSLLQRRGRYGRWDDEALAEAAEFLKYDCIDGSGATFGRPRQQIEFDETLDWLLINGDFIVRSRPSNVLDYLPSTDRFAAAHFHTLFCAEDALHDESALMSSLLLRIFTEL